MSLLASVLCFSSIHVYSSTIKHNHNRRKLCILPLSIRGYASVAAMECQRYIILVSNTTAGALHKLFGAICIGEWKNKFNKVSVFRSTCWIKRQVQHFCEWSRISHRPPSDEFWWVLHDPAYTLAKKRDASTIYHILNHADSSKNVGDNKVTVYDYCITPDNLAMIFWKAVINSTIYNGTTYMYSMKLFSCNGSNTEIVEEYSSSLHNTSITTGNLLAYYNKSLLFEIEICNRTEYNCITQPENTCVASTLNVNQAGEDFG